MAKDSAVAFLAKVASDPALQRSVESLVEGDGRGLLDLAAAHGFAFGPAELREALSELDELDDEELDRVAGGVEQGTRRPMAEHVKQSLSRASLAL